MTISNAQLFNCSRFNSHVSDWITSLLIGNFNFNFYVNSHVELKKDEKKHTMKNRIDSLVVQCWYMLIEYCLILFDLLEYFVVDLYS